MHAETLSIRRKAVRFQRGGGHYKPVDDKHVPLWSDRRRPGLGVVKFTGLCNNTKTSHRRNLIIRKINPRDGKPGIQEIIQIDDLTIEADNVCE
jgi:hypothetical protein